MNAEQIQQWARDAGLANAFPTNSMIDMFQRFATLARADLEAEVESLRAVPQAVPAEPSCPDCKAPDLLYECIHCSASNYPAAPKGAA
jgi:hypothetical protein